MRCGKAAMADGRCSYRRPRTGPVLPRPGGHRRRRPGRRAGFLGQGLAGAAAPRLQRLAASGREGVGQGLLHGERDAETTPALVFAIGSLTIGPSHEQTSRRGVQKRKKEGQKGLLTAQIHEKKKKRGNNTSNSKYVKHVVWSSIIAIFSLLTVVATLVTR